MTLVSNKDLNEGIVQDREKQSARKGGRTDANIYNGLIHFSLKRIKKSEREKANKRSRQRIGED